MNDEELRQALAVLDTYREQLEAMTRQAQMLQMTFEETSRARETLKAFNVAEEGDEILVPVGASSFVTAKVTGKKTALVGIGNKLATEKPLNESITQMDATLEEISEAMKKSAATLNELELATSNLTVAIQNEYKRRQQ